MCGLRNKRMNVTLPNTKVCLHGLLVVPLPDPPHRTLVVGGATAAMEVEMECAARSTKRSRVAPPATPPSRGVLVVGVEGSGDRASSRSVSMTPCNTTDHAFERFMPVLVTIVTPRKTQSCLSVPT